MRYQSSLLERLGLFHRQIARGPNRMALRPVITPPIAPSVVSTTKTHPNGIDCCCLCRMRTPAEPVPDAMFIAKLV